LLVDPPSHPTLDFNYRIFNPDGREVAQCGNGARCFGRYVYEQGFTNKKLLKIGTTTRELTIDITDLSSIRVEMGFPQFSPKAIPLNTKFTQPLSQEGRYQITLFKQNREVTLLSLGNPHCILFVPAVREAAVQEIGTTLQHHPAFPKGVNVSFVQVLARNHIKCRVFERGAGETQACGSAATAAVAVGILQGDLSRTEVQVDMPGGALSVSWPLKEPLSLYGPTKKVFQGVFALKD